MTEIENLQHRIGTWAENTFGHGQRNRGIMNHLLKEIQELDKKIEAGEGLEEELADCAMLLFDLAFRNGYDLLEETAIKLEVNMAREWGKMDSDGVIEHIKQVSNE